jgi:hypothetical protein
MSSTTPGWYPDPDPTASAGRQRWFDGTGWTQHVSSPPVVEQPAEQPAEQFAPVYAAAPAQAPVYGSVAPVQAPAYGSAAQASVYGSAAQAPVYGSAAPVQAYGSAAMPFAPAVTTWGTAPATGGHIVVGSMSKAEAKALPRKERNSKDRPDLDLARGRNQLSYNAVLYGAVSLLINPFLLFSIMAIVWSVRGKKRADEFQRQGYPPLGRGQADAGLTLGIIGTVLGAVVLLLRVSQALGSM